ncbi:hypothetical protein J7400_19740 [Shimia sp. R9_2]|uniref:hypothetical protein n=1 Tax=Shimia sp. R9_2 TaxID=2821112 RepID=UPI001ADB8EC3|nr:hypothetical protein [Shimia sp. R9_2]MBO9398913.1 hypothetical protein [Shimia sp. R9_2]
MSLADASDLTTHSHADDHGAEITGAGWVYTIVALLVVLWGTSIALFGIPGLYIPAVGAVPVIFLALVLISRG